MTPLKRLEGQQRIAKILAEQPPINHFHAGNGGKWLLCIAQGIQTVGAYALACEGVMQTPC